MNKYSWEQQRNDIQRDINGFLGKNIEITPRAMTSLQSGDNMDFDDDDEEFRGVYNISVLESRLKYIVKFLSAQIT